MTSSAVRDPQIPLWASVIIPAYNAAGRIGETVQAASTIPGVAEVVVVDDGSNDPTAEVAERAGATWVASLRRNRGKGAALRRGLAETTGDLILLIDDDLGATAAEAGRLLDAVRRGEGDLAIAVFPRTGSSRGLGLAVGLARFGIALFTGLRTQAPLSGQRALRRSLLERTGIADGFGVEVAMTIAAAEAGARVVEIPLSMAHRATGRDLLGFWHRGRQFWHALRALVGCALGRAAEPEAVAGPILTGLFLSWVALPSLAAVFEPALAWVLLLCAAAGTAVFLPVVWLSSLGRLRRTNYQGRRLPAAMGLLWVVTGAAGLIALPFISPPNRQMAWLALMLLLGFGAVGLIDDLFAGSVGGGLRGHFRQLLHGRLTTGAAKALFGGALALAAGWVLERHAGLALLDGLLIALCANTINLLDLRPGRALKGFAVLTALALVWQPPTAWLLGPLLSGVALLTALDCRAMAMMGDVGSNSAGAMVGLALAAGASPVAKLILVGVLALLHLFAERASITRAIAANRPLRWLDHLGCDAEREPTP